MEQHERQALDFLSTELTLAEARMYEHISTTFRWVMATLFTANGGAIVTLFSDGGGLLGRISALSLFALGLVLSIIMGVLSTFMGFRAIAPITKARAAIRQAIITTDIQPAAEAVSTLAEKQKLNWKTLFPTYAGLGSLICFIGGLTTITLSILN